MNVDNENGIVTVTDPEQRRKVRECVKEAANSLVRMDAERDNLKAIRERVKDEFEIPPKQFNKMFRTYHKQNYGSVSEENKVFENMYESIMLEGQEDGDLE